MKKGAEKVNMISSAIYDIKKIAWPDKSIMDEIFMININSVLFVNDINNCEGHYDCFIFK